MRKKIPLKFTIWGYERNYYFRLVDVDKPPTILYYEKRSKILCVDANILTCGFYFVTQIIFCV